MKNLLFLFCALAILFFIILKVSVAPPKVIPEESLPTITTTTDGMPESPTVTPGSKQVILLLNQKTTFNDIIIEPWAVMEDSRCVSDAQCVQAGRAVVALNILSPEGEHILSKELVEGDFFYAGSTKITLQKVNPYPASAVKIPDGEYRFSFLFEVIE